MHGEAGEEAPFAGDVWMLVFAPVLALLLLTALFRWLPADQMIGRLFYGGTASGWPYNQAEPWLALYRFGPYPGLALGLGGAVVAVASYLWSPLRRWREMGLFLAILLAIGPGLAVNGIVKPQWSRPRPAQTKDFGGQQDFVYAWGFGPRGVSKSFPSGHASMGFYLMAPAFLLYRRHPRWALACLLLGLASGGFIGLGRMAQGQHFASDVLWSGGLVYFCGVALGYLFHRSMAAREESLPEAVGPVILTMDGNRQEGSADEGEADESRRRRAA